MQSSVRMAKRAEQVFDDTNDYEDSKNPLIKINNTSALVASFTS